jgi:hypothetical protein
LRDVTAAGTVSQTAEINNAGYAIFSDWTGSVRDLLESFAPISRIRCKFFTGGQ